MIEESKLNSAQLKTLKCYTTVDNFMKMSFLIKVEN